MPKKLWTIIPFDRVFRDILKAAGTMMSAFRANPIARDGKADRLRDKVLALRTPLETARAGRTRWVDDEPTSCIIPIERRSQGEPKTSEARNTLTTRYAVILANTLDIMKNAGLDQREREGRLDEALRAKGLLPTHVRFDVAQRLRRDYKKEWDLRAPEVQIRRPRRDRNGRVVLDTVAAHAVDGNLELLRILHIAISRASHIEMGRNALGSDNIKRGKLPSVDRMSEKLLGSENVQLSEDLSPSDLLNVAIRGHVNPAALWLDRLVYADLFDVAVFAGQAVAGHAPVCNPAVAAVYRADIKRSHPKIACTPRAIQDREWYARELREWLDKPAYASVKGALEHAIETIPESDMRATIPENGNDVLYVA